MTCVGGTGWEKRSMGKYEIIIVWSEEDAAYVADIPELPGCMAHGDSHEEALAHAKSAAQLWLETAKRIR